MEIRGVMELGWWEGDGGTGAVWGGWQARGDPLPPAGFKLWHDYPCNDRFPFLCQHEL